MTPVTAAPVVSVRAAASHWLWPVLTGAAQPLRVVGRGGPATYLQAPDTVIVLQQAGGVLLPNALTVPDGGSVGDRAPIGARGSVGAGALRIGTTTIVVHRWWDPVPALGAVPAGGVAWSVPGGDGTDAHGVAAPAASLRRAALRWRTPGLAGTVDRLIGRGPGSTPAGDDIVAGLLATLRAFARTAGPDGRAFADALARAAHRRATATTALSATLLRCADEGAVIPPAAAVLRAVSGRGDVAASVARLAAVGHTSGRDLLRGIGIGVAALTTGAPR